MKRIINLLLLTCINLPLFSIVPNEIIETVEKNDPLEFQRVLKKHAFSQADKDSLLKVSRQKIDFFERNARNPKISNFDLSKMIIGGAQTVLSAVWALRFYRGASEIAKNFQPLKTHRNTIIAGLRNRDNSTANQFNKFINELDNQADNNYTASIILTVSSVIGLWLLYDGLKQSKTPDTESVWKARYIEGIIKSIVVSK